MEFHVQARTYDSSGGSAIYSIVGDQLMLGLGDYGTAIKAMEITVFHRSTTTNPRRDLQQLFDRYHEYLKRLPTITFRRKLNRVEIGFLSGHFDAEESERWRPSVEKSYIAALEVAEALTLLKKRLKQEDDFDIDRFLKDANEVLKKPLESLFELEAIRETSKQQRLALYAAKSPWEQLEIDWSEFHPSAL